MTKNIDHPEQNKQADEAEPILEVTELIALKVALDCPYCHVRQEGFFGDFAGEQFNCDDCKKTYKVSIHAEFP